MDDEGERDAECIIIRRDAPRSSCCVVAMRRFGGWSSGFR